MTGLLIAALLIIQTSAGASSVVYTKAAVGADGVLRVTTRSGETVAVKPSDGQVGFEQIAIAEDGTAVGWVGQIPNTGGTAGPIPVTLTVLSKGTSRSLNAEGLPIFGWCFMAGVRHVALRENTMHGNLGLNYKLYEVATGALVAEYTPKMDAYRAPLPDQPWPVWVLEFQKRLPK